jgi:pyruvate dehydrogenase E2 component (dihydrolipoamide acetyltransferase)
VSVTGPKGDTTIVEPTAAERTVARRAAESRATVPHLELSVPAGKPAAVSTACLLRACAQALAQHPRVNAAYRDGHFELYSRVNIGLVLAQDQSYLIPTVFDADRKPVEELEEEVARLREQAGAGELSAPAFSGATFTVWNASEHGLSQASIPVVPPQAGALAAGTASLTLTCDHRILYGAQAAAFLTAVRRKHEQAAG